ncbi:MAG: hypothetical protein O7B99_13480 [Planctomycetota bacterium]|nr:hypothetical protein [Planctomycetota bacterium]
MADPTTGHLRVGRTARYHVLGEPGAAREVWYVLHGYGQLAADFLADLAPIARPERLIVAPEGLSRFYLQRGSGDVGASWMTREDRAVEIEDHVAWLDALHEHLLPRFRREPTIHVLGFSQGTATAGRWVALGHARPVRLVLWGGWLPPDLDLDQCASKLRSLELTHVYGDGDSLITSKKLRAEETRLASHGIETRRLSFEGGHRLDEATLVRLVSE